MAKVDRMSLAAQVQQGLKINLTGPLANRQLDLIVRQTPPVRLRTRSLIFRGCRLIGRVARALNLRRLEGQCFLALPLLATKGKARPILWSSVLFFSHQTVSSNLARFVLLARVFSSVSQCAPQLECDGCRAVSWTTQNREDAHHGAVIRHRRRV